MINKKQPKPFSIILILLVFSLSINNANAQGPNAPEAASFEPVDATDMVNLLTGDFAYVLPLLNVPSPEGGYPIALSYHAGIAMDQEASWVGLGWSLNPGVIKRDVIKSPDDWYDVKSYNILTSGINKTTRFGFSVGILGSDQGSPGGSIGLYVSHSENRAFTGETEFRTDFGITGSINTGVFSGAKNASPWSISGSIGTDGATAGVGLNLATELNKESLGGIKPSFTISQSFRNGSTNASLSAISGTGISLNSKEGLAASVLGKGIGLNNSINGAITPNITERRLGLITPFFSITYSQTKFWVFEADYAINQGALYAGAMDEVLQNSIFGSKVDFDSYESYNPFKNEFERGNFTFIGYDNYSVSGQGISGNMHPLILEPGYIKNKQKVISNVFGNGVFMSSIYPDSSLKFNKRVDETGINDVHFYFQNEFSSYLSLNTGNWDLNHSNSTNILDYDNLNNSIDSDLFGEDMYMPSSNRLRKGKYVETYTNEQLVANPNLIFKNGDIDRTNLEMTPEKGIGAFKITTIDGKTYHYTIPVYQREQVSRSASEEHNMDENFSENQQFDPYATHWLLTAITGPDFIDSNFNNEIDNSDYGYWITFDYGKWSDGYAWRNPRNGVSVVEKTKLYTWGVKDVYYLDKIQSRTHTALFVKEDRADNTSSTIDFPENTNDLKWFQDIHHSKWVRGNDGNFYLAGIYGTKSSPTVSLISANTYHGYSFKTNKQKSLRLDKIIIIKNEDIPSSLSKSNINEPAPKDLGEIEVRERLEAFNLLSQLVIDTEELIYERSWTGEFYANVLDKYDLESLSVNIEEKAFEVIDFNYDELYPLAEGSFNSDAMSGGRLTLKSLSFNGHLNQQLIPDYKFDYTKKYLDFDEDKIDAWGYYENNPDAWSLESIVVPTGGSIYINYESDEFLKEVVQGLRVFTDDIQFAFSKDVSGNKQLSIRNDASIAIADKIDFTDYYEVGKEAFVDALYWRHPPGNTPHRMGDIAKYCNVISVASDEVIFAIPNNHFSSDVRRDENCIKDYWVYYNDFDGIIGGWYDAIDSNSCGDPRSTSNGTRVRYTFIANKSGVTDKKQGGLRVSNLITMQDNKSYKTTYDYTDLITGNSSGVTVYAPVKDKQSIDFLSELPSPQVMYKNVRVSKYGNNQLSVYTDYEFNVYDNIIYNNEGFDLDGMLHLTKVQDEEILSRNIEKSSGNNEIVDINFSKHKLVNNTSTLGVLLSLSEFNVKDQLISKVENEYGVINDKLGFQQESFKNMKIKVSSGNDKYFLNTSSKEKQIAVLKESTTFKNGYSFTSSYVDFDPTTGKVINTVTMDSKGNEFKTELIPAYTISDYNPINGYGMGSKVDNPTNKNMLTQEAMSKTYLKVGTEWKETGVGITTWNNDWTYTDDAGVTAQETAVDRKVWRKHKSFVWDGSLNTDGTLNGFTNTNPNELDDDNFNWALGYFDSNGDFIEAVQTNPKWKNVSTATQYDHYSMPLEVRDINNNHASTKTCDGESKILAVSNAKYTEMYYSGAEYLTSNTSYFDGQVKSTGYLEVEETNAHTGIGIVRLTNTSQNGFEVNLPAAVKGKFKVSVWARVGEHTRAKIKVNNTQISFKTNEQIRAGNWMLLNGYVDIPDTTSSTTVAIVTTGGNLDLDDFRLYPITSSMTSYVYNEWDELWYIIGNNGLASKFEYDAAGRLKTTYSEVEDFDNGTTNVGTGGFKRVSENDYNYKNLP